MFVLHSRETLILGQTQDGRDFRPSDWAERLAGVMSSFHPGGSMGASPISYSPWCLPNVWGGTKCVVVHEDLRDAEPMAWDFVMNFARDNGLKTLQGPHQPPADR